MAGVSQNFPRTFYNLASSWDAHVGTMTSEQCRNFNVSRSNNNNVAQLLHLEFMVRGTNIINELQTLWSPSSGCQFYNDSFWIYNMRSSDTLPRSPHDLGRLYRFVRVAIGKWFSRSDQLFMEQHIHVAVCFFLWYITKPHFFFKDKVTKQTTRHGIQRVWTPLLLAREVRFQTPRAQKQNTLGSTTNAQLPKQQKDQENLKEAMQRITGATFEWEDSISLHLKMSEFLSGNQLNINQVKKLQKHYNDYRVVTDKIIKTLQKIRKVEAANAKITPSKPQSVQEPPTPCSGCAEDQPNQQAHMGPGGCLDDTPDWLKNDGEANDEDVPDSWEDL